MKFMKATFLSTVLILSSCQFSSSSTPSKDAKAPETASPSVKSSKSEPTLPMPQVDVEVEMETVSRQAKITASNSEGLVITAKNNYNHSWSVEGDNSVGGIIHVNPITKVVKYQSASMSTPIQSMVVNPDGSMETVEFNAFGSKKTIVIDTEKNMIRIDVSNSPRNMLIAKKAAEGLWDISGSDEAGKNIQGALEVNEDTGFIAYKGSNGSFIYQESISIDYLVAAMSLVKGLITEESIEKELQNASHRRTTLTIQIQDLLYGIISKMDKP
jgi:hypothetical protein